MTLVELLMALGISGLVAVGVASMLVAVSYGTSSTREVRQLVVRVEVVEARLDAAVRGSKRVLSAGTDYVLLWAADTDGDATTDNNEVRLIERIAASSTLYSYADPAAGGDFVDAASFRTTAKASYPSQAWASSVTALSFTTDASPPNTRLLSYTFSVENGDVSDTAVGAVGIRN